jgi:hypothetical protein
MMLLKNNVCFIVSLPYYHKNFFLYFIIILKNTLYIILGLLAAFCLGTVVSHYLPFPSFVKNTTTTPFNGNVSAQVSPLPLGAFSISLSVKDLQVSMAFYKKLGFIQFAGNVSQNYVIMKNEQALVGLFQGMFKGNMLTFNPGWDYNAQNLASFDDIRVIQKSLQTNHIILSAAASDTIKGPAYIMLSDPDSNQILIDQHR